MNENIMQYALKKTLNLIKNTFWTKMEILYSTIVQKVTIQFRILAQPCLNRFSHITMQSLIKSTKSSVSM